MFHKTIYKISQILSNLKFTQNFLTIFSTSFNLRFFEFSRKFFEYLLKMLINYLEIEFINKNISSHHPPNLWRVAAWLMHWPMMILHNTSTAVTLPPPTCLNLIIPQCCQLGKSNSHNPEKCAHPLRF